LRVVCNTSPLILLAKIGRLDLLTQLYEEVVIPQTVLDETGAKSDGEASKIQTLLKQRNFQHRKAEKEALDALPPDLGAGEREAIALALETKADFVILDDRQARRVARGRGLSVTGTVGVLVESRERNVILSLRHELDRLIEAGMWISEIFYHRILQEFDE
jgi:predicted nucleic acid-binding protein